MRDESINALIKALKKLSPQAPTPLVPPSFDWSSKDQYDDFQLFIKSVKSWFTLQGIPEIAKGPADAEIKNPICLDYILSFLGNQGRKRHEHWQPAGEHPDAEKQKASAFLTHLQSTMDHEISIRCRIYKLEETRILPGESPDELVDHLRALADRCNFPSDDEKERNVQYCLVRALDDWELVKKLLAMPITATTAKMLETCRTHIAINGEMDAMGLGSSKNVHTIHKGPPKKGQGKGQRQGQGQKRQQQHSYGNCTKHHAPRCSSCPAKDAQCRACGKTGHWKVKCHSRDKQSSSGQHGHRHNKGGKYRQKQILDVGTDDDLQYDEVRVAAVLNEVGTGMATALNQVGEVAVPHSTQPL